MYLPLLTIRIASVLEEHPVILCEAENATTSSFHGVLQFAVDGSLEHISISSLLLRGWSLDCRVGGWLCDLCGEWDQNRVFDALETPEEGVGNAHAVESNDCVSPLSPLVYLHCRCVGSDSDVGQFAGFGRMGLAIPLQRVHCRFQRRRPLRQELLRLFPAVLPDRSRVALRLRGDRVCDVVGSHRRLLLQSFFMENDLDCFESSQDHIHVRNAGIIR